MSERLDLAFRVSVGLKGLNGLLEIIGVLVLLFVSGPHSINQLVRWASAHELAQDPHDVIARRRLHSANQLSRSTTLYGAIYLLAHGIAKVVLLVPVLREGCGPIRDDRPAGGLHRLTAVPVHLLVLGRPGAAHPV
jgi:uncharacterized membrane protein